LLEDEVMHTMILISTLLFALGCSLVPLLRVFILHEAESHKTISDGLSGPWHWIEDAGFAAFAAAFAVLGVSLASPVTWLCWLVAAGVLGAMVTDSFRAALKRLTGWTDARCRKVHLASAYTAFGGALALECALARGWLWALVALYPIAVGVFYWLWPKYTAWQEKAATAAIVIFLLAWSLT